MSGRTVSLAASLDGAASTATTASTSASTPGGREHRRSGNRLMVRVARRQYHRAIRQPGGSTCSYGVWRAKPQPPSGWNGQNGKVAVRRPAQRGCRLEDALQPPALERVARVERQAEHRDLPLRVATPWRLLVRTPGPFRARLRFHSKCLCSGAAKLAGIAGQASWKDGGCPLGPSGPVGRRASSCHGVARLGL